MLASKTNQSIGTNSEIADQIWQILSTHSNALPSEEMQTVDDRFYNRKRIQDAIESGREIEFILPAFPAKSPNPEKTATALPDFGEVLGLERLQNIADRITAIYSPGALIHICSDGRVFSDLVQVDDLQVSEYRDALKAIIQDRQLVNLRTFNLEDVATTRDFSSMREALVREYARTVEQIRADVKRNSSDKLMFNGIHRFVFEDYAALKPEMSRNQLRKQSKEVAYQVIQRSNAWSAFVEERFPQAVRLSIHPQIANHRKFGVQLVNCENRWGTPWHNIVLRDAEGFRLMKKSEALALGAVEKFAEGKYLYFEIGGRA